MNRNELKNQLEDFKSIKNKSGMSFRQISEASGVPSQTIQAWSLGYRTPKPSSISKVIETMLKLQNQENIFKKTHEDVKTHEDIKTHEDVKTHQYFYPEDVATMGKIYHLLRGEVRVLDRKDVEYPIYSIKKILVENLQIDPSLKKYALKFLEKFTDDPSEYFLDKSQECYWFIGFYKVTKSIKNR